MDNKIIIDGHSIELVPFSKEQGRGLWLEAKWAFDFFKAKFLGHSMVIASPKKGTSYTPLQLEKYERRLTEKFDDPIVFLLPVMPAYQRLRLSDRKLNFIISDKYALLPFFFGNRKIGNRETATALTPFAQQLLLWHLQIDNIEDMTLSEIAEVCPMSYLNVSRATEVLEDLGLCVKQKDGKNRRIHFPNVGKELWAAALPYMFSPVKNVFYCDSYTGSGAVCGINALAHYSNLNPENIENIAVDTITYRSMSFTNKNKIEGNVRVEIWKYPPLIIDGIVDKLSLILSLKDDKDERVQKEIELILDELWCTV